MKVNGKTVRWMDKVSLDTQMVEPLKVYLREITIFMISVL
jgi:hypothetical protein